MPHVESKVLCGVYWHGRDCKTSCVRGWRRQGLLHYKWRLSVTVGKLLPVPHTERGHQRLLTQPLSPQQGDAVGKCWIGEGEDHGDIPVKSPPAIHAPGEAVDSTTISAALEPQVGSSKPAEALFLRMRQLFRLPDAESLVYSYLR